ncbi:MAG: hypothetical protein V3U92_13705 [Cellulophaga sp.]
MQNKYLELKINRDFGDIITIYFDFFKQNIKKFSNVFIRYNGIFLIGLLIISYLLVSGAIGLIHQENSNAFSASDNNMSYYMYIGFSAILFFIIFLVTALLNYSLSTSYMIHYDSANGNDFDKTNVWSFVKDKLGKIILFVLILIPIYIGFMIVSVICAIIPIIGIFAQYILQFFLAAWIGVSFFVMLKEGKDIGDSFSEGWHLVTKNFWKSVGVNLILGILIGILILLVLMIPGILIGLYTWHVVENDVAYTTDIVTKIIYTLGMCSILIVITFSHCLSQFINGILYFTLHEKTYNTNTRNKIDQIGNLGA